MPTPNDSRASAPRAVLELVARDATSAVRHVAACLARRACPLFGLACLPESDGSGRLVLAVADDGRLDRLLAELAGLPEVAGARRGDARAPALAAFLGGLLTV